MSTPADLKSPDELRPLLHGKIDKLGSEGLQIMHRVLLRLEVEELAAKVGETVFQSAGFDGTHRQNDRGSSQRESVSMRVCFDTNVSH